MPHAGADPSRVLLIRPTALGDVCRTVPALVTLRRAFPAAHIDWLVNDAFADAVRHHPALNGIVAFPRGRFASFAFNPRVTAETLAWVNSLRQRRYDLVVDLQGLLRSGLFTWITRAPRRIGYADARELGWLGYNQRFRVTPVHAVERAMGLLEAAGFPPQRDMSLYPSPQDQAWLDQFLDQHGLHDQPYFTLAPTARWLCKCWPLENWVQIVRRLLKTGAAGAKLVLIVGPSERQQVQPLLDSLGPEAPVIFPQTSVGQMMAIISHTRLLLCNDSAPMHVAVGFDRPIVSVFGPTDPALEGPYRRDDTVVQPPELVGVERRGYRSNRDDQTLIARVSVEMVWNKTLGQLQRPQKAVAAGGATRGHWRGGNHLKGRRAPVVI